MTPRPSHPASEAWALWLGDRIDADDAAVMERHLEGCARCRREVEFLEGVHRAAHVDRWKAPAAARRRRARRIPTDPPAIPPGDRITTVGWTPPDIRGAGVADAGEAQMITHSFPEGEVGILAVPPNADGLWRLEGRIWLTEPDSRPIRVVLLQGDHVLAQTELSDGGHFELREAMGPGWCLEIHLPEGRTLVLEDESP